MSWSAERWAFELTKLLNAALGPDRFPVDVRQVAIEVSKQRFPDDRIVDVVGANLPNFDGALYRMRTGGGWKIVYNNAIASAGRINFTLAHELGHYFLHRLAYPNGFECGQQEVVRWDTEYGQIEAQANEFAATLLMPLDDFRRQISARERVDLERLKECAARYRVSLIAVVLRWLRYTERRAVIVVSRDGFILWSRASAAAHRSGAFFRTSNVTVPVPDNSLAANTQNLVGGRGDVDHRAGVWLADPVREMTIHAEQYDFSISLLTLDDATPRFTQPDEEREPDASDRFAAKPRERFSIG
ncbi:ImmA/IrrE family metallo-endopeptidase [Mesorhizobium sp. AA22]|uniref:ImmA/IrrE family metallo-endopeptidase n=1 Tax=Mesorhizobium sp. AA22 TaxID=1854057 RepID=UPI0007EC6C7C|nr:ImmA/IrrE family metallo-endopeptidase [Mesorhizobium sp. AA22]QIA21776.1 ImmA/IrrE family metallo-endopeptidase [Mesorhizobium sp. AA22]